MKQTKENLLKVKNNKAITLIALVITIIVLLILAGVTIVTLTGENGLIIKAGNAKEETLKAAIREKIQAESAGLEPERQLKNKTDREIFEEIQGKLVLEDAQYNIGSKSMIITTNEGYIFTVLYDGTVKDGKFACLDIADGTIQLKENGYIQKENQLVQYDGDYIITGTTTEHTIQVMDEGTYNITLKDLNIDVSNLSSYTSPINANKGSKAQGCYVNIILEGKNILYSNGMAGIHFCGERVDTPVETNRSTLTIGGEGYLDTECKNGYCGAGIGGNYTPGTPVCDIVINSGNIKAIGRNDGCGIGGGLRQPAGNITINSGIIYAKGEKVSGIGSSESTVKSVTINGGNITAVAGEWRRICILTERLIVKGGTINAISTTSAGISCVEGGNIKITGGNILARGKNNLNIGTYSGSTLVPYVPKNSDNNLYETQIKLQDVGENQKITKLIFGDSIEYGINDMYTLEDGMLYLYLPLGERTITIECDGKTFSGTINTTESSEIITLNSL